MDQRPRDRLGRPIASDSTDVTPGIPQRDVIDAATAWAEAMGYLDDGLPFHSHEVFEQRWRCCPPEERELWRGLAQWAAALTHAARGNAVGASSVGAHALDTLRDADPVEPVDLELVRASLREFT